MEELLLNAEPRSVTGKQVRQLRRDGYVPAVVYGHHREPTAVQIERRALEDVLQQAGITRLITLQVEGAAEPARVLVRDFQRHALNFAPLHIDFFEVTMTEKLETEVPIVLVGEPAPVKAGEGMLLQELDSLNIKCLPGDIPAEISVDITRLQTVDDEILVKDLSLSEAIEVLDDAELVVAKILPIQEMEIEEVAEAAPSAEEVPTVKEESRASAAAAEAEED